MSALAVLSVIAPAVSAPSKGASEAADSGFESMLADVVVADALPEAVDASVAAPSAGKVNADAAQVNPPAPPVTETPVPEVPFPVMLVTAPVIPEQIGETAAPAASATIDTSEPLNVALPVPADRPDAAADPTFGTTINAAATTSATTTMDAATAEPNTPASASASVPAPVPVPIPATATATATATAMNAQATTSQAAAPQVLPVPAPALRPLADRTSRPVEGAEKTPETPAESRSSVSNPVSTPFGVQPDGVAKPPAAPTKTGVEPILAPLNDDAEPEAQATADAVAAQTQTTVATRDVALSGLSRATIDATAQIAAQILRKLEGRSTRFEMALHPEDLGRVDVKLDIDSGGRLSARLAFDNPAAATDLRGRADELRRQLEDAGFHLSEDAFEFAERDSGSSAFDRGRDARHGHNRAFAAASRLNDEIDVAQPPRWLALKLSPSGVDMKV